MKRVELDPSDKCHQFIGKHWTDTGQYRCVVNGRLFENTESTCHSSIRTKRHIQHFYGVYYGYSPEAKLYWQWLTNKDSIFREFTKHRGWEEIWNGDTMIGFKMPDKVWDFDTLPLVYAFLICSRVPHEAPMFLQVWAHLSSLGVNKNLAYVMAVYFTDKNTVSRTGMGLYNWQGNHQIFDDTYHKMDFKKFISGEYNKNIDELSWTRSLWTTNIGLSLFQRVKWDKFGKAAGKYYRKYTDEELVLLAEEFMKVV